MMQPNTSAPKGQARPIRLVWSALDGARGRAILAATNSVVEGLLEAGVLLLFARIALNSVSASDGSLAPSIVGDLSTFEALGITCVLISFRLLSGLFAAYLTSSIEIRVLFNFRGRLLRAFGQASFACKQRMAPGSFRYLIADVPRNASSLITSLVTYFSQAVIMLAMLLSAFFANPVLTMGLVTALVALTFFFFPLRRWIKRRSAANLHKQGRFSSKGSEIESAVLELEAFGVTKLSLEHLNTFSEAELSGLRRLNLVKGSISPLYTAVTFLAVVGGLAVLSTGSSTDLASTGPVALIILRSLSYGLGLQHAAAGMSSVQPLIAHLEDSERDFYDSAVAHGDRTLGDFNEVALGGLSFSYPGATSPAIRDVSTTLRRGERVGIVGPSGGGKSTLGKLLLGAYFPDGNDVKVDGEPLRDFTAASWSGRIGFVPQEASLLAATVRENVAFFRDGITDEDILGALTKANLLEDLERLGISLDTEVGPGLRELSGGQRQRLSIARALAAHPSLVIMDEPTSSVDAVSEGAIADAIEALPEDVTVVIISHRLRVLRGCERLIVIEGGEITAEGSSAEILGHNRFFQLAVHD